MWYKVNELFSDSLNKTQIGQSLGLHRQTVAKYLSMTEEEFISSQSSMTVITVINLTAMNFM